MAIIQLSYLKLLEEITEKIGIETPRCNVTTVDDGWFVAHIDFKVVRVGSIVETIRCWGGPFPDVQEAKEEAAGSTIQRMKHEFGLKIKDINYEDFMLYKNMHGEVTVQYATLLSNYNNLQHEYNMLKDSYNSTIAQNAAEQVKLRSMISEYRASMNFRRRDCSVSSADPSDESSGS